ncbi:hypothetical protein ACWGB8_30405 [Kitasatospora sp. NPDC054939]
MQPRSPGLPGARSTERANCAQESSSLPSAEDDLALAHTLHHLDADDGHSRLQLFFRPTRLRGHVRNQEPHKCHRLAWWPLDRMPDNTVPYTVRAVSEIARGNPLSVLGWAT